MKYYYRNPDSDFGSVFGDLLEAWSNTGHKIPPVDVYETKEAYITEAEVAGYDEDKINIHVDNHVLKLSAEGVTKDVAEGTNVVAREICTPAFERSFTLPEHAEESKITADYKNGILLITVPKKSEAVPRRIEVKINK